MERIAYFDNAATTFPKPEAVYSFMDKFYRENGVNVGRGQHSLAASASALVAETRELLLELCHCPSKRTVFTHTATEALNIVLRGLEWLNGATVYVSPFEHNAVTRVLHYLSNEFQIRIETLAFNKSGFYYDMGAIREQFANVNPDVVVISHASNVCGAIAPIADICTLSKGFGSVNVIDMCQTMGLIDTDLSLEAIDFAIFAGHKTLYAPLGVAGFICSHSASLQPLLIGGTGVDSANLDLPQTIPERFEVGSPNIAAISGLNASLHWIKAIGLKNIHQREEENRDRLIAALRSFGNIRIVPHNTTEQSVGVVSCVFDGYASDSIGQVLNSKNVAVRTGLHCSPTAHKFLGTFPNGTVRFSVGYFNDDSDFSILEEALSYIEENS